MLRRVSRPVDLATRLRFDPRLLDMRRRRIPNSQVNDSARTEPNESSVSRQLHAVDQLTLTIHDVVDRTGVDILAGPDPEIPVGIRARRAGRECRFVVRELTRRDHREWWQLTRSR